jgi:MFS family permease
VAGTALLALTLASYCLAMTIGGGRIDAPTVALLGAALAGAALFIVSQARARTPLVHLAMLRDRTLSSGLATSMLVSAVMMATLVVGPFYLSRALGLGAAGVGAVMSVGPAVVVLAGIPAGRIADRVGPRGLGLAGLAVTGSGAALLALTPTGLGIPGYVAPIVVLTLGYAVFQTANNTAVMAAASPEQRGVTSGLLNLSRNLGLITGASVMGTVFAIAAGTTHPSTADPGAIATGLHATFALGTLLIGAALAVAVVGNRSRRAAGAHA